MEINSTRTETYPGLEGLKIEKNPDYAWSVIDWPLVGKVKILAHHLPSNKFAPIDGEVCDSISDAMRELYKAGILLEVNSGWEFDILPVRGEPGRYRISAVQLGDDNHIDHHPVMDGLQFDTVTDAIHAVAACGAIQRMRLHLVRKSGDGEQV